MTGALKGVSEDLGFPHVQQVTVVYRRVTNKKTGEVTEGCRLYISTENEEQASVEQLSKYSRAHWIVENCVHWVRDAVDKEDSSRIRGSRISAALGLLGTSLLSLVRSSGRTSPTIAKEDFSKDMDSAIKILRTQRLK